MFSCGFFFVFFFLSKLHLTPFSPSKGDVCSVSVRVSEQNSLFQLLRVNIMITCS